jgi:hypothetical protein
MILREKPDSDQTAAAQSSASASDTSVTEPLMIFSQEASALYPTIKKEDVLDATWELVT